jgi:hypothetical protein
MTGRREVVLVDDRHRAIGNCGNRGQNQASFRSSAQQPIDVVGSEVKMKL